MSNSQLFKQAHKMTKLTIQPNDTYRYKFGQWLIFLKTGVTNMIKPSNKKVNLSVCYVPVLRHDKADKFSYTMSLPFTLTRYKQNGYSESYYIGKMLSPFILVLSLLINLYLIF